MEDDNRQEWIFTLYDFDNSGKVTKEVRFSVYAFPCSIVLFYLCSLMLCLNIDIPTLSHVLLSKVGPENCTNCVLSVTIGHVQSDAHHL